MSLLNSLLLASALLAVPAFAMAAPADATRIATQLLDRLDAGDYTAAETAFNAQMAAAVPADKLKTVWESLPAQAGAAKGRGQPTVAMHDSVSLVAVPLHYANAELVVKIAVAADGKIVGFLIQPAPPPAAADAGYSERDLNVGAGERALPGTLALPKGNGPFPGVVLVHGSGPQDRDETIGANRPFLDIARGLAAQGVAVLRYEKRTKARPQDFAGGDFDVDDETTRDAVAAVAALRATPGIDPQRMFVLGHSQGGMLAPRIAKDSGHVAGLILLAAPARPLLDILIEQNRRLAAMDGSVSVEEQAFIDALTSKVARIRAGDTLAPVETPLGQPAGYWRSIDKVDAIAEARAAGKPLLILQGGRDIQVVDADWQRWHFAFDKDPRVTFKRYPALNHLAIAGEGPGTLAEYQTPGHVDAQLIDDVATWIRKH